MSSSRLFRFSMIVGCYVLFCCRVEVVVVWDGDVGERDEVSEWFIC